MFEAPLAEDRLAAIAPSDSDAAGAGSRVLWIPGFHPGDHGFSVSGPVFFYHRLAGVRFGVRVRLPTSIGALPRDTNDVRRTDVQVVRAAWEHVMIESRQFVLPNDSLVCEVAFFGGPDHAVNVSVEAFVELIPDVGSEQFCRFGSSGTAIQYERRFQVPGHPDVNLRGVAMLSALPDIERDGKDSIPGFEQFLGTAADDIVLSSEGLSAGPSGTVEDDETETRVIRTLVRIPPGAERTMRASFALTESREQSRIAARRGLTSDALTQSARSWIGFLGSCPVLKCSDPVVETRFAASWVDGHLASARPTVGANPYREPFVGSRRQRYAESDS
ncbi:MAG: hypothetical protein HKN13_09360, partial [Rhodothermales bacterium]|nr:hypothetical protein [Rhodothermales bacterium]